MKIGQEVTDPREITVATASDEFSGRGNTMNCAEFQRDLPLIIDTGGSREQEEHLSECAVCRDLVNDLRYIAEQAKLLIPMHDPSPRVWDGIERRLKVEGLAKPARIRR